ncbi:MAG: maleylpyruvate isomerase family mycothiol-dependent enzyme [Ilumatobacteraceae bacterium]
MDLDNYLAVIAPEAELLAATADEAGLATPVPNCPDWTIADLVLHVGEVHRWATAAVAGKAMKLGDVPSDSRGPSPEPADTTEWFRRGAAALCDTLRSADPDVQYATFLMDPPAPNLLFWARRQALETTVHRTDAESAVGRCTPVANDVALDGLDEFLTGFVPRSRTPLRADVPRRLQIAPYDSAQRWTVSISSEAPVTRRHVVGAGDAADADCVVSGPAGDLYLALWNRAPLDTLTIDGDRASIDLLRDNVHIRWA